MKIRFNLNQINQIVEAEFIPRMEKYKIFTFQGPLGAGKTTLIKAILKACGVKGIITSPTFNYVNSYKVNLNQMFYHFDLYRLDSLNSFLDLGFHEYFYEKNSFSFVEWPGIVNDFLKSTELKEIVCKVCLSFDTDNKDEQSRILEIK